MRKCGHLADARVPTIPGEGNRQGQTIRGEGEGTPVPMRPENARESASTATGAQREIGLREREENDALPLNVRGASGERLSAGRGRWRTVLSWLLIAGQSHRLGVVQGNFPPVATPADTRIQQRPVNRTIETAAQPAVTATAQSLCPLPAGRGRGRTLPSWMQSRVMRTIPEPGGLQQQIANGEESETGCLGQQGRRTIAGATDFTAVASTSALPAIVPLPVGDVEQTTAPAWTRARTGGLALAGGVLRHQTPSGAQQEGNQTPTEDGSCIMVGRLALERATRTTLPARANTETRVPGVTPGGVHQPSSRRLMATSDRSVPPSPHTNGAPQNRAASRDQPSPRPTLRQRRRSPSLAAVDRAMVPQPVGRGRWTTTPA